MNNFNKSLAISLLLLTTTPSIPWPMGGAHNAFFYRSGYFFGEPRIARDMLGSIDIAVGTGSTRCAYDQCGHESCLLDICGAQNMHQIGVNLPNIDVTNPVDLALTNLSLVPSRCNFAHLSFEGEFGLTEFNLLLTQNFINGFFAQLFVPYGKLSLCDICFKDISPTDDICPNINTPEWQTVKNLFNQVLQRNCLSCTPICKRGLGDITFFLGWTYNNNEIEAVDYWDTTFKIGFIFPSGQCKNIDNVFDIPLGHNDNYGVVVSLDSAIGGLDWITFGGHFSTAWFNTQQNCERMKTACCQSGCITLAKGRACIDPGLTWVAGGYAKADHFVRGLSLLVGYSFTKEQATRVDPIEKDKFGCNIVQCDCKFSGWNMHTIHFLAEYDFTTEEMRVGPRIGAFFNWVVHGERVFKTNMAGGTFGLDIAWRF